MAGHLTSWNEEFYALVKLDNKFVPSPTLLWRFPAFKVALNLEKKLTLEHEEIIVRFSFLVRLFVGKNTLYRMKTGDKITDMNNLWPICLWEPKVSKRSLQDKLSNKILLLVALCQCFYFFLNKNCNMMRFKGPNLPPLCLSELKRTFWKISFSKNRGYCLVSKT